MNKGKLEKALRGKTRKTNSDEPTPSIEKTLSMPAVIMKEGTCRSSHYKKVRSPPGTGNRKVGTAVAHFVMPRPPEGVP